MSNLIDYIRSVYRNLGKDTKLKKLPQDGISVHTSMIEYFTRFRDDILQHAKPTCFEELTVFHLLSFMGKKGYENGIGLMSAEERTAASEKGIQDKRKLSSGSTEEAIYYTIDGADENGKYILIAETFCTNDQSFMKKVRRRNGKRSMIKFHTIETINELQLKKCATQSCTNKKMRRQAKCDKCLGYH